MKKLVVILGLTSSGKSDLGIALAKIFNGEIVSADSRQVYKGLDWCSGKVSAEEQRQAVHHLLDEAELGTQFTLYDFQKLAYQNIDEIISRGKLPFLVGGTGLYLRSVTEGYNLTEQKPNDELRAELNNKTLQELITLCKQKNIAVPPEPTARRLIRLLEKENGQTESNKPKYNVLKIGIKWSREEIYKRIEIRLKRRLPNMIKEIKALLDGGADAEFLRSLGLEAKCTTDFVLGVYQTEQEFFEDLFKQERHFAKRQQTWFNKESNVVWLEGDRNLETAATKLVQDFLNN